MPEGRDRGARRRFVFAYALSIVLHALLVLFFVVQLVVPQSASEEGASTSATVTLNAQPRRSAEPIPVIHPPTPLPRRGTPRRLPVRPLPARPPSRTARAPQRPELSKIVPSAPPLPEPARVIARAVPAPVAKPTAAPTSVASPPPTAVPVATTTPQPLRSAAPVPLPTAPPATAPPLASAAPTERPTQRPAAVPNAPPTVHPSAPPTVRPTAAPTAQPTARTTAVPTARATAAPTARATAAPTARPTAQPTAAASPAPTAHAAVTPRAQASAGHPLASPTASGPGAAATAIARTGPAQAGASRGHGAQGQGQPREARTPVPAPTPSPRPAPVVRVTPGKRLPTPIPSALAASVNRKLASLIPTGDVAYQEKHVIGDLHDAIARAEAEYLGKLAPPPEVLRKALYVVDRKRTGQEPDSVTYVLKKMNILGFHVCTGWRVVAHPLGGGPPDGYYVFGPCGSDQFEAPPWAATPAPTATTSPHA